MSFEPEQFLRGARACLPTVPGYWSIGFAAGALGALGGYSLFEIILLAGVLYAGSAQFLFYALHAAGATFPAIVAGVMLVNLRHLLMGSFLAPYFAKASALEKVVGAGLITDETFAVAARHAGQTGALPSSWLLGLNLTAWLNWLIANIAGALLAGALPAHLAEGLGFSLTAMFIGLMLTLWFASRRRTLDALVMAAAAVIVLAASGHMSANLAVLLATAAAAAGGALIVRHGARTP